MQHSYAGLYQSLVSSTKPQEKSGLVHETNQSLHVSKEILCSHTIGNYEISHFKNRRDNLILIIDC